MHPLLFSTIEFSRQAFHRTALAAAIVNLKPIVPGHVLVIPSRVVPRLSDLSPHEISALFHSVQLVGRAIERAYGADGLTIACQDGKAAGQSVSHVHVHILPRRFKGDRFANNDDIYPTLEAHGKQLASHVTHIEKEQVLAAEQAVQPDHVPSPGEVSRDNSKVNMDDVATPSELFLSPGVPASARSSSHESKPSRVDDEERKPRSLEDMEREAEWLKTFMKEVQDEAAANPSTY